MNYSGILAALWVFAAVSLSAQTNFERAEELFMRNKPEEAAVYLENAVAEDGAPAKAFLYLGIAYEQLDRTDEAIAVYRQVLEQAGDLTAHAATNLGNACFKSGNAEAAEEAYTRAIAADSAYAPAWLGRANTRLKTGGLQPAIADYEQYLALDSRSAKRGEIGRLIALIKAEFAAEERRRLIAEEAARAEAERKRRLLDEVSASLQSAAESSRGLSSGAEDLENYAGEFELE